RPTDLQRATLHDALARGAAGTLRAVVDRAYPLDRVADAHRHVEHEHKTGTVGVTPGGHRSGRARERLGGGCREVTDDEGGHVAARTLLEDLFGRIGPTVTRAVDGLGEEALAARLDPGANSIAWLAWHLARGQDAQVAAA